MRRVGFGTNVNRCRHYLQVNLFKIHPSIPFSPSAWWSDLKVSAHCEQLPRIRAPGFCRWPSDVGLPVRLGCYKSYHLAGGAVISPPAFTRDTLASMSVSVRAQLLLFLISLSSIVARGRFIEVRVFTVKSRRVAKFKREPHVCFRDVCRRTTARMDYILCSAWTRRDNLRTLFSAGRSVSAAGWWCAAEETLCFTHAPIVQFYLH